MMFPVEIWEEIFLYADPLTLVNLRTVCKCWKEIIDKTLKDNDHWYKLCKREIPENLWPTLCETLCPTKFYAEFHTKHGIWMAMYKLWMKSKNIVKGDTEIKCFEPLIPTHKYFECITCIDVKGSFLALGSSKGFVYFYNIHNLHKKRAKYVVDSKDCIRSVHIFSKESTLFCISCTINNHIHYWDVKKRKLIDKRRGKLVCTSYSYCCMSICNYIIIEGPVLKRAYEFGTKDIVAVGASNNKVLFYTEEGHFATFNADTEQINYVSTLILPLNIKTRWYYIFQPNIVMCVTEYGYLGVLVEGKVWKIHNVFSLLHGIPTAVLVHGHLLVLGLDSGNIHMFYIKDFDTMDFNCITGKKLTLDVKPVLSLRIAIHYGEYLIVAYEKKIYTVRLL